MSPLTPRSWSIFAGFVVLALVPHVLYLNQPFFVDEGPMISAQVHFVYAGTVVPNFANHPSFSIYLTFPASVAGLVLQHLWSDQESLTATVSEMLVTSPVGLVIGGRMMVLLTLLGAAALAWRGFGRYLGAAPAGIGALLLLATPGLLEYASFLLPDVPLLLMCMAVTVLAMRAVDTGADRSLYWVAICAGLAVSTKYNGASMALVVAVAGVIMAGRDARRLTKLAAISAALCLLAFLIGSPGWLLDTAFFWDRLRFEIDHAAEGHLGNFGVPILGQLELLLTSTPVLSLGTIAGLALWARAPDRVGVIALVVIVAGMAMAVGTRKQSLQYLFILIPGMIYFAAFAAQVLLQKDRGQSATWLAFSGTLAASLWMGTAYLRPSSVELVQSWLERNVSADQRISRAWTGVPEYFGPEHHASLLNTPEFVDTANRLYWSQPTQDVERYRYEDGLDGLDGSHFVVTSERVFGRFFEFGHFTELAPPRDAELFAMFETRRDFYQALFASADWEQVFQADTGNGSRVLIFARKSP